MQLLTPTAKQRVVRCVLHERMPEGVFRIGRTPALEDQLGIHELFQNLVQLRLWHWRYGTDQLV